MPCVKGLSSASRLFSVPQHYVRRLAALRWGYAVVRVFQGSKILWATNLYDAGQPRALISLLRAHLEPYLAV